MGQAVHDAADGQSITVRAKYGSSNNAGPAIDFSPALRFNPTKTVTLTTAAYASVISSHFSSHRELLRNFGIYYTPDLGMAGATDAAFDQTLRTYISLSTGLVWRRVKHFSGYSITVGLPCDPSPDNPDCVDDGGPIIQM